MRRIWRRCSRWAKRIWWSRWCAHRGREGGGDAEGGKGARDGDRESDGDDDGMASKTPMNLNMTRKRKDPRGGNR